MTKEDVLLAVNFAGGCSGHNRPAKNNNNIAIQHEFIIRGNIMMISTEAEFQAAQEVFRKYHFNPGTSKNHPLQASLDILAAAVDNYQFLIKDTRKAA